MAEQKPSLPPLSLYIHFPWCLKKCPYCDFNSHETKNWHEDLYVASLLRDLNDELAYAQGRKLGSIFFGGGTPSLMSAKAVDQILTAAANQIGFDNDIEITLEANPGAVDRQRFHDYQQAGVNRISIGAQSFNDRFLKQLGRIHESGDIVRAVDAIHAAHIENFNIDLMFALPGQSLEEAIADLDAAIRLLPTHLSWYQLTIEPNTVFYREQPVLPNDDIQLEMTETGHAILVGHGYSQYEISAFAQPGRQCRHNRNYWEFGDYIGIGAGAHGKITTQVDEGLRIERRQKIRIPESYMQSMSPCCQHQGVSREELAGEFAMNALRLTDGVQAVLFSERTGLAYSSIADTVRQLVKQGLLQDDAQRLAPTRRGALYLNEVVSRFL